MLPGGEVARRGGAGDAGGAGGAGSSEASPKRGCRRFQRSCPMTAGGRYE